MKNDYSRKVSMQCPTCGNQEFEHSDDSDSVTCIECNRTLSKDELFEENSDLIENYSEEMLSEIRKDIEKDLKNIFKGFGKG